MSYKRFSSTFIISFKSFISKDYCSNLNSLVIAVFITIPVLHFN